MSLWGLADNAANSALFACIQVGRATTTDNQTELFGNTTPNVYFSGATVGQFGVAANEMTGVGGLASVTITNPGDGFTDIANISFTGANTGIATAISRAKLVGATANQSYLGTGGWEVGDYLILDETGATVTTSANLQVATVEVSAIVPGSNSGTGYANGDTLIVSSGTGTQATANITVVNATGNIVTLVLLTRGSYTVAPNEEGANTTTSGAGINATANVKVVIETITLNSGGIFTGLPDDIANNTLDVSEGVGNTATIDLSFGVNDVIVTANGSGYAPSTGVVFTNGDNAAASVVLQGRVRPAHAGWILRTVGSGGRAGRVFYETLVAIGSMTEDASDDEFFSE